MRSLARLLALLLMAALALQLYFGARIALMSVLAPESTSFQRSEAWRLAVEKHQILWSQQWVDDARISKQLKRAVIASEDAGFSEHGGVDWDALEKAWEKNQREEARLARLGKQAPARAVARPAPKVVGGSTITQQLAKNLFLSGERNLVRKGQEFVLTLMLEGLLSKQRILEIYLNNVEWGEGVFGAQAAARHYFRVDAVQLASWQAARLAVMLPAPKRFEKRPSSPYVIARSATIEARMPAVALPE
ncbi:monofunctional biosynthetic peptidoglycan transglycosylase [Paucibacter soli]|uniref:monofunctional biosynthetic peptidoglycan transglycosylase n=1 Tax=Paucibacter soli TaxID=3133433 RepID=UPI00309D3D33